MVDLTWNADGTDWDAAVSEQGVVHEAYTFADGTPSDHTDAGVLKQGYSLAAPYLDADLVAYWPMHEDTGTAMHDVSINANHGTITGPTLGVGGMLGTSGYQFDAVDDYVSTPIAYDETTPFTIAAWVTTNTDHNGIIANAWDPADNTNDSFQFKKKSGGHFQFLVRTASGPTTATDTSVISNGDWHHVVGVHYGANSTPATEFYVDGVSEATGADPVGNNSTKNWWVGDVTTNAGANPFDGSMSGVWAWGRALTATEIQTHREITTTAGALTTASKTS